MKVRYFLPPIDDFQINLTAKDYSNKMSIIMFHNEILTPIAKWLREFVPGNVKMEIEYHRNVNEFDIRSAVVIDMPNEYASMFILKFGAGYNYFN